MPRQWRDLGAGAPEKKGNKSTHPGIDNTPGNEDGMEAVTVRGEEQKQKCQVVCRYCKLRVAESWSAMKTNLALYKLRTGTDEMSTGRKS